MIGLVTDPWSLAGALAKAFSYVALLAVPGGVMVLWLSWLHQAGAQGRQTVGPLLGYLAAAGAVGLLATAAHFLIQVGAVNRSGLSGMLDPEITGIMLDTALGDGVLLRLMGFALVLAAVLQPARRHEMYLTLRWALLGCAVLSLSASFFVLGHAAGLHDAAASAAVLHFLSVALWAGALYPLFLLCARLPLAMLQALMRHFGRLASGILLVLVVSGSYLLWQLTGSWSALTGTGYGQALLAKLVLVGLMMLLAGLNRYRLVPALHRQGPGPLRQAIAAEMTLAALILLLVAALTTVGGPPV